MRLLGECRGSIDTVKRMGFELKEEEDTVSGLADPSSSESQTSGNNTPQPDLHFYVQHDERLTCINDACVLSSDFFYTNFLTLCTPGVIERWELLQAQDLSKEIRTKQSQQQWQQLNSDLNNVWMWLRETEEELEQQRRLDLSTDIQTIEMRIKKLKVLMFLVQ